MINIFGAHISRNVADLLHQELTGMPFFEDANQKMHTSFGINQFFDNQEEYIAFTDAIAHTERFVSEPDRTEYGDFQTNIHLAKSVVHFLKSSRPAKPETVIEPTCGKGHFIIAALSEFKHIRKVVGIEIYKPYVWEAKCNIIDFYSSSPTDHKPEIEIIHHNVFDFDFSRLANTGSREILILGNPPWVTNAKLSSLDSGNLPPKSNFKRLNGFDAITGKGNFDIGEYITLMMLNAFQNTHGHIALLVKNSVIKNIVFDQYQHQYPISNLHKLTIDSKKEFGVSVEAALFFCTLNTTPAFTCQEFDFYQPEHQIKSFGWFNNKFVSDIDHYHDNHEIEGVCPLEWRQGIKHDLSHIMELERVNGHFVNGRQEEVSLEEDLIYGILKSSDLKQSVISHSRKHTIVTQKKAGQDTSHIRLLPKTFQYLQANKAYFNQRKSTIYLNKPDFSIFGIGDYSFAPYKVAISGLYKTCSFCLILPEGNKPLMVDDTCYLLGFDRLEFAAYTSILLNSDRTKHFLQSITFPDAKRTFTKDVLMRIDLYKLSQYYTTEAISREISNMNEQLGLEISTIHWNSYIETLKPKQVSRQTTLF